MTRCERVVTHRRVCWPNPDATCLEGGCGYCNGYPHRSVAALRRYAERAGTLPNRASGDQPATRALAWGVESGWPNVDVRTRRVADGETS